MFSPPWFIPYIKQVKINAATARVSSLEKPRKVKHAFPGLALALLALQPPSRRGVSGL